MAENPQAKTPRPYGVRAEGTAITKPMGARDPGADGTRVYIKLDMEGISGIVSPQQLRPDSQEYEYARRMLMHDLGAVLEGAFGAGCAEAVVYDAHLSGRNVDLGAVDRRASVIVGGPHLTDGFVYGLDDSFDALFLVGFHARAGASGALFPHTYEDDIVSVRVNGTELGEIGVEAALAGEFGVPLVLVSADSGGVREARELLGNELETVQVKEAITATSGVCLPGARTAMLLREAATRAVRKAPDMPPVVFPSPTALEVVFTNPDSAAALEKMPSIQRTGQASVRTEGPSIVAAYRHFIMGRHHDGLA